MSGTARGQGGGNVSTSLPNPPPPPPTAPAVHKSFKAEFRIMKQDIPTAGWPAGVDGLSIKEPVGIKLDAEPVYHNQLEAALLESIRKEAVRVGCANVGAINAGMLKKLELRLLCTPYTKKVRYSLQLKSAAMCYPVSMNQSMSTYF